MDEGVFVIILVAISPLIFTHTVPLSPAKTLSFSIDNNDEIIPVSLYLTDIPETSDGTQKLIIAALLAYDQTGVVSDLEDEVRGLIDTLKRRDYVSDWFIDGFVWEIDASNPVDSFKDFFEYVDSITANDDRVVLILAGHGGIVDGTYYFAIKTKEIGTKKSHYVISDFMLHVAMSHIGSALDFVWLVSCESSGFIDNVGYSIEDCARNVIVWGYRVDVASYVAENDLDTVKQQYEQGNPAIEDIYYEQIQHSLLDQLDLYYGLLRLLSLRPAEPDGTPINVLPGGGSFSSTPMID